MELLGGGGTHTACCSGGRSPLGAAERSPQDFTLFLINYRHDLSANVREAATLDNTCNTNTPSTQTHRQHRHLPAPPPGLKRTAGTRTCEELAIFLLYLLCIFKLLLGMFLRDFIPQINRIFLLPGERKRKKALRMVLFQKFDVEGFLTLLLT